LGRWRARRDRQPSATPGITALITGKAGSLNAKWFTRDGRLDLPDDVLAELDWVQASVHRGQRMPRRELTKRVEEALRNPCALPQPSEGPAYQSAAGERSRPGGRAYRRARGAGRARGHGLPDRLDLSGEHVRGALRAGVQIVCSTDGHSVRGLGNMALSGAPRVGDGRTRLQHPTVTRDPRWTSKRFTEGTEAVRRGSRSCPRFRSHRCAQRDRYQ
jgi:hypothetical protein